MEDERREILSQVAQGILSPQEAATHLDELDRAVLSRSDQEPGGESPAPIRTVRIVSHAGQVLVQGDSSVKEAVAEGPHRVTHEGDTMVISLQSPTESTGFFFSHGRPGRFSLATGDSRTLQVRVNPNLALQLDTQAGSLRCNGVRGPIGATVQAGSTTIEGCEGPLNVTAQAGSLRISGRLTAGVSRVRCEAGSVHIDLLKGSSVRVTAAATMGKVSLDGASGGPEGWGFGKDTREVVVGAGAASLDIEATMGSVRVATEV